MHSLLNLFIRNPILGNALMVLIAFFGWQSLRGIQTSYFPERETREILIQLAYPGASPEEMEEGVVLKIEDKLEGLSGIEEVRSTSNENSATVTVEVKKGEDIDLRLQDVKNAVDQIASFPVDLEPPIVYKNENKDLVVVISLTGNVSLQALKDRARVVEDELRAMEGISQIEVSGYPGEEIEIAVDDARLRAYGLSVATVAQAVAQANLDLTGGRVKKPDEEFMIRVRDKTTLAQGLLDLAVGQGANGEVVRLAQVAEVRNTWADEPAEAYYNGERAVQLTIRVTQEEDLLTAAEKVRTYQTQYNQRYQDIQLRLLQDQSVNLQERIDLLQENGLFGAGLVLLMLALFLQPKLALWVALGIPISFMGMFILAELVGLTINQLSLFGMILVVGILVDDGIVIGENIYQYRERGLSRTAAALRGTLEMMPAVVAAIFTTVVAFCTFFFLDGRLGDFASDLALVVILTLLFSLVEAGIILPMHLAHTKFKVGKGSRSFSQRMTNGLMAFRNALYAPLLRAVLRNPLLGIVLGLIPALLAVAAIRGGVVRTTFFPSIERNDVNISLELPPGTPDERTLALLADLEATIWAVNDSLLQAGALGGKPLVRGVGRQVGPRTNMGKLDVDLLEAEFRPDFNAYRAANLFRQAVGDLPGVDNLVFGVRGAFGSPVAVALLSNDLEALQGAQEELKAALRQDDRLKDVKDDFEEGLRELVLELTPQAQALGLKTGEVTRQVRQAFFGYEVQRLQRGRDEVRVWVRLAEDQRASLAALDELRIRTADGGQYPLRELATYHLARGPASIRHLDGRRVVQVEADLLDPKESATDVLADLQATVLPTLQEHYPNVGIRLEGQSEQAGKTLGSFQRYFFYLILPLFFFLILWTFRSLGQAVLVVALIPLTLSGLALGHHVHGLPISILSLFGLIALIGVLVNDALVFVSAFNQRLKEGGTFAQSLYGAGLSRFRPILLTTVTTVAGMGPLLAETSFQSQFLKPMAATLAWGLLAATGLTLVVLPSLLVLTNTLRRAWRWLWTGHWPEAATVEPARQKHV